jgi:hypothetical protein
VVTICAYRFSVVYILYSSKILYHLIGEMHLLAFSAVTQQILMDFGYLVWDALYLHLLLL